MRKSRFREEQVIGLLQRAETGRHVADLRRRVRLSAGSRLKKAAMDQGCVVPGVEEEVQARQGGSAR